MPIKLYVVAASHPCWAVARALELKGLSYKQVELPPGFHAGYQRLRFGQRTVPGLTIDGERIVGSRAIMHRLDGLAPSPPLYPGDARVEEADRWGDEVLQSLVRRLTWWALRKHPPAILSYAKASTLPFPEFSIKAMPYLIGGLEWRLNGVREGSALEDVRALPGHLDRVDEWISSGVLGGVSDPNAADLQIGSSLALLRTMRDARALTAGRPCDELATRWFAEFPGEVPAGVLPAA